MRQPVTWNALVARTSANSVEVLSPEPPSFERRHPEPLRCRCRCGAEFEARAHHLWAGRASCGCLLKASAAKINPSRRTYGQFAEILAQYGVSVIGPHDPAAPAKDVNKVGAHRFRCKCGGEFGDSTSLKCVASGNSTSCGCKKAEAMRAMGAARRGLTTPNRKAAGAKRRSVSWQTVADLLAQYGVTALDDPGEPLATRALIKAECRCGNRFEARAVDVLRKLVRSCGCARSFIENEVYKFVLTLAPDAVKNTRTVISPLEIDVWVPSARLGIELHGLYWHSEAVLGARAQASTAEKVAAIRGAGHRALVVFEDEWLRRRPAVEALIVSLLGGRSSVGARECEVAEDADTGRAFEEEWHLQGAGRRAGRRFVLRRSGAVVASAAFAPDRAGQWELTRYVVGGVGVRGGLSKLLAAFWRAVPECREISTFSDNRYSAGGVYRAVGFREVGVVPPRYWYTKQTSRYHRFQFRRDELVRRKWILEGETEEACMRRKRFSRVWDAGKVKWVIGRKPPVTTEPSAAEDR